MLPLDRAQQGEGHSTDQLAPLLSAACARCSPTPQAAYDQLRTSNFEVLVSSTQHIRSFFDSVQKDCRAEEEKEKELNNNNIHTKILLLDYTHVSIVNICCDFDCLYCIYRSVHCCSLVCTSKLQTLFGNDTTFVFTGQLHVRPEWYCDQPGVSSVPATSIFVSGALDTLDLSWLKCVVSGALSDAVRHRTQQTTDSCSM